MIRLDRNTLLITNPMKLCLYVTLSLLILMPRLALGQQPPRTFADLQSILKIGDAVRVTDSSGRTTQGRIAGVSMSSLSLVVDGRQQALPEDGIREIKRRRPDRWWDGALLGAGIGAAVGFVTGSSLCDGGDCGEGGFVNPGFGVFGTVIGAGAGALVDLSIRRFDTLFARPPAASVRRFNLSPILSRDAKGLRLSTRF